MDLKKKKFKTDFESGNIIIFVYCHMLLPDRISRRLKYKVPTSKIGVQNHITGDSYNELICVAMRTIYQWLRHMTRVINL